MASVPSSPPARLGLFREPVPTVKVFPVIESEAEKDGLEMPRRVYPWATKATLEPAPLTANKPPQGSPIVEETETEYDSDEDPGEEDDDFAIASDDDEDLWMDSTTASINNDAADNINTDSINTRDEENEDSFTFKRLPTGAYGLRKSSSMLSLAFKASSMSGKPPMSRTAASRQFLSLRRTQTADGLGARSNHPYHTISGKSSSRPSVNTQPSEPDFTRVPSEKEVRSRMLVCELTEDDRRNLDWERRWPWGRGIYSPATVRNKGREQEQLSDMFSKPPKQEPFVRSWGAPLHQRTESEIDPQSQPKSERQPAKDEDMDALIFKCPTCSW